MYAGQVVEDAPVDAALDAAAPSLHVGPAALDAAAQPAQDGAALDPRPRAVARRHAGRLPLRPRCTHGRPACEQPQPLLEWPTRPPRALRAARPSSMLPGAAGMSALVEAADLQRAFPDRRRLGDGEGGRRRELRHAQRRDLRRHRRIRLGQVDAGPRRGLPAEADGRHAEARRRRSVCAERRRLPPQPPRLPDRLPGSQRRAQPAHDDPRQRARAARHPGRRHARRARRAALAVLDRVGLSARVRATAIRTSCRAARSSASTSRAS